MQLDVFLTICLTLASVWAQSSGINAACAKGMQTTAATFTDSRTSMRGYADTHAPFTRSVQPALATFTALDAAPLDVTENDTLTALQKQSFGRFVAATKAMQVVTGRVLKSSVGDDASDVLEDLDVLQFTVAGAATACAPFL